MSRSVFAVLGADYGNIGDALIYREALAWSRSLGQVHANVGQGPAQWVEQLGLDDGDLYGTITGTGRIRSNLKWLRRLCFGRGPRALVLDPGETALGLRQLPRELLLLVATAIVKLRNGLIVRPPHAIRVNPSPVTLAVYRLACALSTHVYFRNFESRDLVGSGEVVPDLGFGVSAVEPTHPADNRSVLAISLRGHRPHPGSAWVSAIKSFAEERGLSVVVFSQVSHDDSRSGRLAADLGAQLLPWHSEDLGRMEVEIQELYRRSMLVLSDRMHILVYAALYGCIPVEAVPSPSNKIRSHFRVAGIEDVSFDTCGKNVDEIVGTLTQALKDPRLLSIQIHSARASLHQVKLALPGHTAIRHG